MQTKIPITDHNALSSALYEMQSNGTFRSYVETEEGYKIQTSYGEVIISFKDGEYKVQGSYEAINSLKTQLLTEYESIVVREALIDKGYMTDVTRMKNTIQIQARRV
jgi:hypothetical protein